MSYFTMHQSLSFGLIYGSPKQSYVFCRIMIGIKHSIAVTTSKLLASSATYVEAIRASFTRIVRWNRNQFNTIQQGLVGKKLSQLTKRPFTYARPEFLAIFVGRKFNVIQIFDSNSFTFGFSNMNNLLTDGVISDCAKSSLTTRKPFQKPLTRPRAFSLNRTPNSLSFLSVILKWFRTKGMIIIQCANIHQPKITTNKALDVLNIFFKNFYCLKQIKLAFFKHQIRLTLYIRKVFRIMANKRYFQSTIDSPHRNFVLFVRKHSAIIRDTTQWLKCSLNFLVQSIAISYLGNTADNHLRRKIERGFNSIVNFVVDFILSPSVLFKAALRNFITSGVTLFQSIFQGVCLFRIWQQLYLQSQFHGTNIIHLFEIANFNSTMKTQDFSVAYKADECDLIQEEL